MSMPPGWEGPRYDIYRPDGMPWVCADAEPRGQHYADQARIAQLERQLATAISVALDRDQRLAKVEELLVPCVCFRRGEFDGVSVSESMKNLPTALRIANGGDVA